MKKQLLTVLVLPAMMLTSCSKGAELTKEEALERQEEISEKQEKQEYPDNMELSLSIVTNAGKGKEKESSKVEYVLKGNEDGESYFKMKGGTEEEYYDFTIITVKNETYEEVTYLKSYDKDEKKTTELVLTKKGSLTYEVALTPYQSQMLMPAMFFAAYQDPASVIADFEYDDEDMEEAKVSVKYYSTGAGNLTLESSAKYTGEVDQDEEIPVSSSSSITYDNYLFKSYEMSAKSNYGNVSSMKLSASYSDKKISISLPSNWEELLNA